MRPGDLLVGSLLAGLALLACQPELHRTPVPTAAVHRPNERTSEAQSTELDTPTVAPPGSGTIRPYPSQTIPPPASEVPPTLTVAQQRIELSKLLAPDETCRLPCWWGLIPRQTSWVEAEQALSRLGAQMLSRPVAGSRILHGVAGLNLTAEHIDIWLSIWERAEILDEIRVTAAGDRSDARFEPLFRRRLRSYFPDQVLEQYGPPEAVGVALKLQDRISILALELVLVYDGFEIHYHGVVPRGEQNHRICPLAGQIGVIRLDLRPSSPTRIGGRYRSIEQAAGMNSLGFHARFQQADAATCMETPAGLWP